MPGPDGSRYISYRHDNGAWRNAAEDHALALAMPGPSGLDVEMTPCMALEDFAALEEQRNGEWRYLEFLQVTSWGPGSPGEILVGYL